MMFLYKKIYRILYYKTNEGFRKKIVISLLFVHCLITKVEASFFLDKQSQDFYNAGKSFKN